VASVGVPVTDPFEQHDLSRQMPEKVAELELAWAQYERTNGVIY
jgi:hypothetical protein